MKLMSLELPKITLSTSLFMTLVLIFVMSLFSLTQYFQVNSILVDDFKSIQKRNFDRQMLNYRSLFTNFINNRLQLLNDLSQQTIFIQSTLQPDAMKDNLRDYVEDIKVAGEQVQISLLDFEGNLIHARQEAPVFDYKNQGWVNQLISAEKKQYFGINNVKEQFFITLATPLIFNNAPEGILLFEIPVETLALNYDWSSGINHERIELIFKGGLFMSLGAEIIDAQKTTVDVSSFDIQIVGYLDNSELLEAKNLILQKIILISGLLTLLTVVVLFLINRRILIEPLRLVRNRAYEIANAKYSDSTPDNKKIASTPLREILLLGEDIRLMSEKIQKRESSLVKAKKNLEKRVDERTAELKENQNKLITINQDLKNMVAELERSNLELDQYAFVASHDLKSPLQAIFQLASWIEEDCVEVLPEDSKKHLLLLKERIKRMEKLLADLLLFSRISKEKYKFESINVEKLIKNVFEFNSVSKRFQLVVKQCDIYVLLPRIPLELIVRNVLSNAIKHHDKSEGSITVAYRKDLEINTISICDDGPGIPPNMHQKVYEMFHTLKPRDTTEGSGLGMSIVIKAAAQFDGKVNIVSDGKRGTCIELCWKDNNKHEDMNNVAD
jgi:signal transduction histidine kinase